ncbi:MAG TPA: hypothetical protein EYP56_19375 [Planctomycetaceae bacterium]|nr:hypothetical protein [Planctomycetaceae bacterium]
MDNSCPCRYFAALAVVAVLAAPAAAQQCLDELCVTILRNNCWPKPFATPERHAVRLPFHLMIHNGWRRQNMLDEHHFQPDTTELTEAGKLKIKWILQQAPRQHRTIYVRVGDTPGETAARMEAVQQHALQLASHDKLPPILQTTVSSPGWPARQVDTIGRKFESAIPDPVLPASSGDGESSQ